MHARPVTSRFVILFSIWLLGGNLDSLAANYYVAPCGSNNKNGLSPNCGAGNNGPFKTLLHAFRELEAGDTLFVMEGTYNNFWLTIDPTTFTSNGEPGRPIVVTNYQNDKPIVNGLSIQFKNAQWWVLDGLTFDNYQRSMVLMGKHTLLGHGETKLAKNIVIRNCTFSNANSAPIVISYAQNITIDNCQFINVRPRIPFYGGGGGQSGYELNAIGIQYTVDTLTVSNCIFEDIGSDGVHIGSFSHLAGSLIREVRITNNDFRIVRPYVFRNELGQTPPGKADSLANVGENAIDVKTTNGPIYISDNLMSGYRPTAPNQDASGGSGKGITIHNNAVNVIVERNIFDDNVTHLGLGLGTGQNGGTRNITIRNNVFQNAVAFSGYGQDSDGRGVQLLFNGTTWIYFNTFYENQYQIHASSTSDVYIKNNLFHGGRFDIGGSSNDGWSTGYNAFVNVLGGVPENLDGANDIYPSDVSLNTDDWSFPKSSPLFNAGVDVGVTDDLYGNSRAVGAGFDIGAFELRPGWSAPAAAITENPVLYQNSPNPFNPTTNIRYKLLQDSDVDLAVYSVLGQRVQSLVSDRQTAGTHEVTWNGRDESGRAVASGVYFLRLQSNPGGMVMLKKMLLVK